MVPSALSVGGGDPGSWLRFIPDESGWQLPQLVTPDIATLLTELKRSQVINAWKIGERNLARLILDGLLQINNGSRFVSGGGSHRLFFPTDPTRPPAGHLGRLSHEVLRHVAAAGATESPAAIANRLYHANRAPISPSWCHRLADRTTLKEWQGIPGELPPGVTEFTSGPWHAWATSQRSRPSTALTWKLYLSPTPEGTARACRALRNLMNGAEGPFSIKVARDLPGALRPDRLVGYFDSEDSLRKSAARLRKILGHLPVQGVPFTASLGAGGLMSWGADLPMDDNLPPLDIERSWRGWLTVRLGTALAIAIRSKAPDPVRYALDRLSLDGVNTNSWAPTASLLTSAAPTTLADADN